MRLSDRPLSQRLPLFLSIKSALCPPVLKVGLVAGFGLLSLQPLTAVAATPSASQVTTTKVANNSATNKKSSSKKKVTPQNMVTSTKNNATPIVKKDNENPTAGLKLISLKSDEVSAENGADDLSDMDSDVAIDQTDDWIDEARDPTAIVTNTNVKRTDDGSKAPDIPITIPTSVAQVSLNAISPETLKTFVAVVDLIRRDYVEPVNDETLFDNAMSGMLTKLDSHAEFLDAEAYENLRAFTEGDVGDIGIKVAYDGTVGYWVIQEVSAQSAADKKGIRVGDYLHQIGGFKLDEDKHNNDVQQLLTGIAGTQVDVITSKAGRRKHATTLQRNNVHAQSIETRLIEGIAIVKLPAFQNNSREQILKSLTDLNAPVSAVLLDLRDNPGGVLTSAVQVASLFMENTDVVQVKSRQDKPSTLSTRGTAVLKPLPVMILQNRYSASAAEVLASSLQTQKRATIIGEVSYGKGSVQSVIPLNNEQAIKLTVAHYLTANGKSIEKIGVQPDVVLSGNERNWEQQALTLLRQQIVSTGIRFVQGDSKSVKSN